MKARLALFSVFIGLAFLAGSSLNFFLGLQSSKVGPSVFQEILTGSGILWLHAISFILIFALIHGLAGWVFTWAVEPVARRLAGHHREATKLALLLFLIAILWVTLQAAATFPHSILGQSLAAFASGSFGAWLRWATGATLILLILLGLLLHAISWMHNATRALLALATLLPVVFILVGWEPVRSDDPFPNDPARPHIILVGIDGWRLDILPRNGGPSGLMPFVESWMKDAAVIEETYTPLARTFPAWWSVFTGQFPANHGARFNLISDEFIRSAAALPIVLGEQGYYRLFAMDERRFANIRQAHGFDQVVGPPLGVADFLIGSLHDAPLTNLIINNRLARYLFPYNHANRADYVTYRPETFNHLLARAIQGAPRQPLFLVAHFELSHWPFKWAEGPTGKFAQNELGPSYAEYLETLEVADRQVESLFDQLRRVGVLDNALVVVLSDHGEAFLGDSFVWNNLETGRPLRTSPGHGTHVLGLNQHQIPLAFRRHGDNGFPAGTRAGTASLADIYPTIVEWLGLPTTTALDGQSLVPVLQEPNRTIPDWPIPLETGFNPGPFLGQAADQTRLLAEGAKYYRVRRDGRLTLKPSETDELIAGKQRALLYGDKLLAVLGPEVDRSLVGKISRMDLSFSKKVEGCETVQPSINAYFCEAFSADLRYLSNSLCACDVAARTLHSQEH